MKINYHTHTELCRHAGGTSRDYVYAALKNNLKVLGISEHAAFPDDRFGLRMLYQEMNGYLQDLEDLKSEFSDILTIYKGLEIEYCPDMISYYSALLEKYHFDYLILGQHFYTLANQNPVNIYEIEQTRNTSCYVDYALSLKEGMETNFFRLLAHPDVIFINDLPWDEHCDIACDIIIKAAKETGTILEFNANGIRRGKRNFCDGIRYPYPHPSFWSKVASESLPVLISSDCHNPEKLWDGCMEEAYGMCKDFHLNIVDHIGL